MNTDTPKPEFTAPLPQEGFVRLPQILEVMPIGVSTWWLGVKKGRYPKPVKLGPNITAWRVTEIRKLLEDLSKESA